MLKTKLPLSTAEGACVVGLCKGHKGAQEINLCCSFKQKQKQKRSSHKNNLAWQMKRLFLSSSDTSKLWSQLQLPLLVCAASVQACPRLQISNAHTCVFNSAITILVTPEMHTEKQQGSRTFFKLYSFVSL